MPAEAIAGLAEGLVPLVVALVELLMLAIQLAALLVEILIYVVVYLVGSLLNIFSTEPHSPRLALTDKIKATMARRFGGTMDAAATSTPQAGHVDSRAIWNPYSRKPSPPFQWKRWHTIALGIWVGLVAGVLITIWWFWGKRFDIVITQAEVQQAVVARFPKSTTVLRVVQATLRDPVVHLDDQADRITAKLECAIKVAGVPAEATGSVRASGRLEYRPQEGAFYLTEVTVDRADLIGVPERWEQKVQEGAGLAVREVLQVIPVYRLKEDRWKDQAVRLVLHQVRVENGVLLLTMGIGR